MYGCDGLSCVNCLVSERYFPFNDWIVAGSTVVGWLIEALVGGRLLLWTSVKMIKLAKVNEMDSAARYINDSGFLLAQS